MTSEPYNPIFTVGHSSHTLPTFLRMLSRNSINAIADVRSHPFSRFNPQFNSDAISKTLRQAGIYYVFLGSELGARRAEPECYSQGKARYDLIAKTPLFNSGLDRLRQGNKKFRIALMCAERDPITCHRTILICRHLRNDLRIMHINGNEVETQENAESRLVRLLKIGNEPLYANREQQVERAYDVQAERIAYTVNTGHGGEEEL